MVFYRNYTLFTVILYQIKYSNPPLSKYMMHFIFVFRSWLMFKNPEH